MKVTNNFVKNLFEGRIQCCATRVNFDIDFNVSLRVHRVDDFRTLNKGP